MGWFGKSVGSEAAEKLRDTQHAVTVHPGASGSHKHKVDHKISIDADVKRGLSGLVKKIKKLHGGHALKALGGLAAAAGAVQLGSSVGRNVGDKLTKRSSHQGQMMKAAVEKKAFWEGFIKVALQESRWGEDAAAALTSAIPGGTTMHALAKDEKGKNSGREWLARIGGGGLGASVGSTFGYTGKPNMRPNPGKPYNRSRSRIGALLGMAAGEVIANRMVHSGKYDKSGKLKKEYGGRHDDEKRADVSADWEGFEKDALQQTRGMEDLATAATAPIRYGTFLHTSFKDPKGQGHSAEFWSRLVGDLTGASLGGLAGGAVSALSRGKIKSTPAVSLGALLGGIGGEVIANRMVHSGKYDESGKLKKEYGGRHDDGDNT